MASNRGINPESTGFPSEWRHETIDVNCDCAGCCAILKIDRWRDDSSPHTFVEFFTRSKQPAPWSWRIKTAWRALRNRREHHFDGISLSNEDQKRLGEFLIDAPIRVTNSSTTWSTSGI